jgi:hypothetical protein
VQRSERTSGDADPGPGDLDHPNDAGVRAVPAAGGAGRQAARAGGVHHAAEVAAAGVVEPPPHHGHHDVKGRRAGGYGSRFPLAMEVSRAERTGEASVLRGGSKLLPVTRLVVCVHITVQQLHFVSSVFLDVNVCPVSNELKSNLVVNVICSAIRSSGKQSE